MAGDWLKMRTNLRRHPKVVRMASALQTDKLRVVGGLHAVWSVFDEHSEDGTLVGYSADSMDIEIGCPGFCAAMIAVDWLTDTGESLEIPRSDAHNGTSAKRRAQETERKREARAVPKTSAPDADRLRSREEKRREEKKEDQEPSSKASPFDLALVDSGQTASTPKAERLAQVTLDAINAYNSALTEPVGVLPKATKVGIENKRRMVAGCKSVAQAICQTLYDSTIITPEFWAQYFGACASDPFHSGRLPGGNGHENWKPDFEYLLKPKTMTKIFEKSGASEDA